MNYSNRRKTFCVKDNAVIMGIESSCDETAVSIVKNGREILSDVIISSATEHVKFGGVVPEIASRAHTLAIYEATARALNDADMTLKDIDGIAVTYGAGLLGALLVGVSFAKALAFAENKPLIPVSHIRGHMAAAYLADKNLEPPFIALLTSGGHTAIIAVRDYYETEVLGSTLDDAVGEAFDKVAKVLRLEYPGGPNIEKLAKLGQNNIKLPQMLKGSGGFDFSYSGLKTAVINAVHNAEAKNKPLKPEDVACSFQSAAIDILVKKAVLAAEKTGIKTIALCGGVAANGYLRDKIKTVCDKKGIKTVIPEKRYCTDNGSMIAAEGYLQYKKLNFADLTLNAEANVPL